MTDLLTRIRAYVAAIPTHECAYCHADWIEQNQQGDLACKICGKRFLVAKDESPANALLREVAALEPVGSMQPAEFIEGLIVPVVPAEFPVGTPLYTLTGATHD